MKILKMIKYFYMYCGSSKKQPRWPKRVEKNSQKSWNLTKVLKNDSEGFPGGAAVKNPPANAGDTGSSPGPGRSHMLRSN